MGEVSSTLCRLRRAFHTHHSDFSESFFKHGRLELFSHLAHDIVAHRAIALTIAVQAYFERHIKEDRLHLVSKALSHLDPLASLVDGKICGVYIIPRHACDQASPQQRTQRGKDEPLVALLLHVVKEDVS